MSRVLRLAVAVVAGLGSALLVRVATGLSGFAQFLVAMVIVVGLLQAFNRQWPTR